MYAVTAGTTKAENLDNNIGSLRVKPMENDLKEISDVIPIDRVAGSRMKRAPCSLLMEERKYTPKRRQFSSLRLVLHGP